MRATLLILALAACGGRAEEAHHDEHDEHGDEAEAAHEDGLLTIAPEMIRDLRVTTTKAEARAAGDRVSALGELHVDEDAYAEVAAPIAARVVKVSAKAGELVTAGQTLAILRSPDLGKARAEVSAAKTRVDLAKQALARKRALVADRLVAEREVIEAEAAVADADADHTVALANLRAFGAGNGNGIALTTPVAGTVIERDVVLGQLADPSRTLFRIGDLSHLWLVAHVFERDAVRVRTGGVATASFAALPGRTVEATIAWVGDEVDASSRTIPVRLVVPNADRVLRPGMSATASIPLGDAAATASVVAVPLAAVQRVGDGWAVFLPRGEGRFEIRAIGRGRDLEGEVEILSGLAPGDELVVDGAFLLKAEADKARGGGDAHHH